MEYREGQVWHLGVSWQPVDQFNHQWTRAIATAWEVHGDHGLKPLSEKVLCRSTS